jgi:hypothetical protein
MKLPQYLIYGLYQFSKESIAEQEEFDRLNEEELAASEKLRLKNLGCIIYLDQVVNG